MDRNRLTGHKIIKSKYLICGGRAASANAESAVVAVDVVGGESGGVADGADDNVRLSGVGLVKVDTHKTTGSRIVTSVDIDCAGGI